MGGIRLGVIGCGNMGSAIVRGVVAKGVVPGENILVNDKDVDRAMLLSDETACRLERLSDLVSGSDMLVIAVKPQDFEALADEIRGDVSGQTVISVMAGVPIERITGKLGENVPVVRAMPNMAAFVSESVTSIAANGPLERKQDVVDILSGIGPVIEVDEREMDTVTALSGSGPAYLFFLADAMISSAEKLGLEKGVADKLVRQTLYGSAALLRASDELPADLVKRVASKGGTTEAALSVFEEKSLRKTIEEAVAKAKKRSEELSKG